MHLLQQLLFEFYRIIVYCEHFLNFSSGREEQAEPDGLEEVTKAAGLMGVDAEIFVETLMKPKLKVGKDYVKKGQNKDQVTIALKVNKPGHMEDLVCDWAGEVI